MTGIVIVVVITIIKVATGGTIWVQSSEPVLESEKHHILHTNPHVPVHITKFLMFDGTIHLEIST